MIATVFNKPYNLYVSFLSQFLKIKFHFYIYYFIVFSVDSHSIDTEDLKGLLYDNETNIIENNEYIKHFLLLVLQSVAMFVVSIFIFISLWYVHISNQ